MYSFTANQAKTQFGEMMAKAQREPVSITRNGKPSVVVLSAEDYALFEELKMQDLRRTLAQSDQDIATGNVMEGGQFFDALEKESR
ncbi:type II toxin-antitoxin system Phd/YefM family antitoxin [Erwinia psidii]|uniref:type II toxin-antitoxin system Phd/YefM family antitoxin n=1 Tax=Erwinia psidii TaxID=69224 RepID=UPI00226B133D|nr:type II toxin-antitoxin system Phd/YefM family antitoxin [Erwinia psidii]MCX8967313.1 type II toxin-antitoxin system Phd/YefM family antitoxin [Erwinia psidii]